MWNCIEGRGPFGADRDRCCKRNERQLCGVIASGAVAGPRQPNLYDGLLSGIDHVAHTTVEVNKIMAAA